MVFLQGSPNPSGALTPFQGRLGSLAPGGGSL